MHYRSHNLLLSLNVASIVRFVILVATNTQQTCHHQSEIRARQPHSPAMFDLRGRLAEALHWNTLLYGHIIPFPRPDIYLQGTRIQRPQPNDRNQNPPSSVNMPAKDGVTSSWTHLPRPPDLDATLLQHHLPPVR